MLPSWHKPRGQDGFLPRSILLTRASSPVLHFLAKHHQYDGQLHKPAGIPMTNGAVASHPLRLAAAPSKQCPVPTCGCKVTMGGVTGWSGLAALTPSPNRTNCSFWPCTDTHGFTTKPKHPKPAHTGALPSVLSMCMLSGAELQAAKPPPPKLLHPCNKPHSSSCSADRLHAPSSLLRWGLRPSCNGFFLHHKKEDGAKEQTPSNSQ